MGDALTEQDAAVWNQAKTKVLKIVAASTDRAVAEIALIDLLLEVFCSLTFEPELGDRTQLNQTQFAEIMLAMGVPKASQPDSPATFDDLLKHCSSKEQTELEGRAAYEWYRDQM